MPRDYSKRFNYESKEKEEVKKVEDPVLEEQVDVDKETFVDEPEKVVEEVKVEKPEKKKEVGVKAKAKVLSNFRKSPEIKDSNILCAIPANTEITVYETDGDFYKAKYDKANGYIKKELCEKI